MDAIQSLLPANLGRRASEYLRRQTLRVSDGMRRYEYIPLMPVARKIASTLLNTIVKPIETPTDDSEILARMERVRAEAFMVVCLVMARQPVFRWLTEIDATAVQMAAKKTYEDPAIPQHEKEERYRRILWNGNFAPLLRFADDVA